MNCNTQNAKIASITEKTLIVGIDVGSETHFARAFDWRNYEYTKKPLEFSNTEAGFLTFKAWVEDNISSRYVIYSLFICFIFLSPCFIDIILMNNE